MTDANKLMHMGWLSWDDENARPPRPRLPLRTIRATISEIITQADREFACEASYRVREIQKLAIFVGVAHDTEKTLNGLTLEEQELIRVDMQSRMRDAVTSLRRVFTSAVTRCVDALSPTLAPPNPADHDPTHGCSTWWHHSQSEHTCALEGQHAGPHVDYSSGSVRLGHEDLLAHVPYDMIESLAVDVIAALGLKTRDATITQLSGVVVDLWASRYAVPHDHTTCGWCSDSVW